MLHYITNTSLVVGALDIFLAGQSEIVALKPILQSLLPDITCRYGAGHGQPLPSQNINNNFFHEQAHAVHYTQVGNNYWASEIAYTVLHNGYGSKTDDGAGRAAVVEAWGFFIGNVFNAQKYNALAAINIARNERQQIEDQIPDDNLSVGFGANFSRGWIPFGLLYDMTDNGENIGFTGVNDNVNTYTIQQIFTGYRLGAANVQDFRNDVLLLNNNLQAAEVNQLVVSYHY